MRFVNTMTIVLATIPFSTFAQNEHAICLHVISAKMEQVAGELKVEIEVKNTSDDFITVLNTELELPKQITGGPRKPIIEFEKNAFDLDPRSSQKLEARVPSLSFIDALSLLFYKQKVYEATVQVAYKIETQQSSEQKTISAKLQLEPLGWWWAVMIGGGLGVLLALTFRALLEKYHETAQRAKKKPMWVMVAFGWLVVGITVFVFRFISTELPQLPITFEIKDFYGGIFIGLIFEPLANWLSSLIIPSKARS